MKPLHPSTLYRTQRLIRMGEWLERNAPAICLAFEVIDRAHDLTIDPAEGMSHADIVEAVSDQQSSAICALYRILADIKAYSDWEVEMGKDVTLRHPNACAEHRYEVVIEAPKPFETTEQQIKNLPTAGSSDA